MDWLQVLVIVFGNIAWTLPIFFWIRSETRNDWKRSDEENKLLRRDMIDIMRSIDKEMKDFYGRMCAFEERRLKER